MQRLLIFVLLSSMTMLAESKAHAQQAGTTEELHALGYVGVFRPLTAEQVREIETERAARRARRAEERAAREANAAAQRAARQARIAAQRAARQARIAEQRAAGQGTSP